MTMHSEGSSSIRTPWAWVPWALGVLALPLGIVGFRQYDLAHGGHGTFFDWVYYTLQLFILHGVHLEPPVPVPLHLARFLAPAATLYALIQTVLLVFKEPFRAFRLWGIRGHLVLVGDGPIARQLALDLSARGNRVLAVAAQELRGESLPFLKKHYLHIPFDATSTPPFDKMRLPHSRQVILAGSDDPGNVATAVRLIDFLAATERKRALPACQVHLFDLRMRQLFAKHRLFEKNPGAVRVSTFNVYENCARSLLAQFWLDHRRIDAGSTLAVRLVVVGFGKMGESLVLQAAKLGHFANGRALEIVVFDRQADECEASFLYRYRRIRDVCAIEFRPQDLRSPQTVRDLARLLEDQDRVQTLALCVHDESLNVTVALDLFEDLRRSNIPTLVRMSAEDGLTHLLEAALAPAPFKQIIHPFAVMGPFVAEQLLEEQKQDALARAIHEDFRERRLREGRRGDDPSMQPWETLGPDFKESNRRQADHIPVKLRAIGCAIKDSSPEQGAILQPVAGFSPQEVEILARMEHASWNAERALAGWELGDKGEQDRKSPFLVPWDGLPKEVQEWDREAVRNIPQLLARVGKSVSR
jgi:hypothetical protein